VVDSDYIESHTIAETAENCQRLKLKSCPNSSYEQPPGGVAFFIFSTQQSALSSQRSAVSDQQSAISS
jgi:hypothetical protein